MIASIPLSISLSTVPAENNASASSSSSLSDALSEPGQMHVTLGMDVLPPSDESDADKEAHGSDTSTLSLSLSLLINRLRLFELESSLSDADEQQHGSPVAVVPITGETVGLLVVGSVVGSRVGSLVGV